MSATVLPTVSLGKVLLLASPAVAALADVEAQLKAAGSDVSVQAPSTAGLAGSDESFDAVVFVADAGSASESIRDGAALPAARKLLKLGGKVLVVIAGLASEARAAAKAVSTDLTFAGFVGAAEGATQGVGSDKALVSVTAAAPAFKAGAAAKFVPRAKAAAAASSGSGAGAATTGPVDRVVTWDAASGSSSAAAGDLIDEESLLEGDAATGAAGKAKEGSAGCAPKRKACRNCTCGRKEEEEVAPKAVTIEPTATAAEVKLPAPPANKSACGNCYKGDAFRCGGCPFLGKPAFQPGSEGAVLLDMSSADL